MDKLYLMSLVGFTRITSAKMLRALECHLCDGLTQSEAAAKNGVDQGNLSLLKGVLLSVDSKLSRLCQMKLSRLDESEEYYTELISLLKVNSEMLITCVVEHLAKGRSQLELANAYGVEQAHISRVKSKLKKLEQKLDAHLEILKVNMEGSCDRG